MALRADYFCTDCNDVFEYYKGYGEDYPDSPECPKCKKCNTRRKYGSSIIIPKHMRASYGK